MNICNLPRPKTSIAHGTSPSSTVLTYRAQQVCEGSQKKKKNRFRHVVVYGAEVRMVVTRISTFALKTGAPIDRHHMDRN